MSKIGTPPASDQFAQSDEILIRLNHVSIIVDTLMDLEGQDRQMVVEMSQALIGMILENLPFPSDTQIVRRWCDVYDSDEDVQRIAGYMEV